MRLRALLGDRLSAAAGPTPDPEITQVTSDSRTVQPGALFIAIPGTKVDGRAFVPDAIARGAAAIVAEGPLDEPSIPVPVVVDPAPRRALAQIAARFHDRQPGWIAAVTGTNGKTSVATLTREIWSAVGVKAGALGTLGLDAPGRQVPGALTTPDPVALHALLAELADGGVDHLVLEASSHGLDQHRVDGVRIVAAAFTNLSRDHFDYHASPAAYYAAKRRLFAELLEPGGTAVLNADAAEFGDLAALSRERGIDVIDYGHSAGALTLLDQVPTSEGQILRFRQGGRDQEVEIGLAGGFQAWNLLAALGLTLAAGVPPAAAIAVLPNLRGARGRLEKVAHAQAGAEIYVDYAHTPDALDAACRALRPRTSGRLVVVVGAGGDRDPGKRPLMGEAVARTADLVYVTDDNPRTEDPGTIRRGVIEGCPAAIEIGDRRSAIREAIAGLAGGDILLIAGKGHETGQAVGGEVLPFDDTEEARAAVRDLAGGSS